MRLGDPGESRSRCDQPSRLVLGVRGEDYCIGGFITGDVGGCKKSPHGSRDCHVALVALAGTDVGREAILGASVLERADAALIRSQGIGALDLLAG